MLQRRTKLRVAPFLPAGALLACGAFAMASPPASETVERNRTEALILAQTKAEKAAKAPAAKAKEKGSKDDDTKSDKGKCPPGQTPLPKTGRGGGGGCA